MTHSKGFSETTKLEGKTPGQLSDVLNKLVKSLRAPSAVLNRKRNAFIGLMLILAMHLCAMAPTFAQTKPAETLQGQGQGSQDPSQAGKKTENTVPNPYEDAVGNMYRVDQAIPTNQRNIDDGVAKILTGNYAPVVFQAAEQGQGGDVQKAANNILNASLGSVNDTYRGMHQFFKDDIVGNLFQNIGQLFGKWLSELIDGWIADTAQFLAKFLRVFVLNPNIAVNGLNGQQNDGISPYIRQGADVMYGIAVDLLLLLFILCIWKFWADASWGGAGNLMGPVGRLIFTAGLLLAWPTIYAFEIQISNEMIKAIYFNSADQVLMLDYALAQAVKGGVIAAGAGATSVFAPLLANLAIPVAGQFVGSLFYFASTMIFTILGGILIAELVYILILKAVQTALLTAQYMFAPIFLVFFATPDTESYATGYVRAFVETSLWTFVWVGLLKVMTIILFSNFNPWGKILISIGVLQLMIQVPSFLGRAQISPVSDFVTAGLVFGTFSKALGGLKDMSTALTDKGINWFTNDRFADKGLNVTKDAAMNGLPGKSSNPELLNSLNKVTQKDGAAADPSKLAASGPAPAMKPLGTGTGDGLGKSGAVPPIDKTDPKLKTAEGKPGDKGIGEKSLSTTVPVPPKKDVKTGGVVAAAGLGALAGALAAGAEGKPTASGPPEAPKGPPPDGEGGLKPPSDKFEWGKSTAEGWNESNLIHVDTRKLLGKLTSVDGVGLRVGQKRTSALGSTANGIQRVNIAEGASDSEMAHAIYSAGFANNVSTDDPARDAARKSAMDAGAHQPKGALENMAANWLSNTGSSWNRTAISKQRFQQAMFEQAVKGSQAYVSKQKGNAYTDYLRGRYGEWGDEQDAMAVHLITNPDSSESPWNRNIGPATDALVSSGIPIGADTRGAMQNMSIQGMHPARRKQAVFAALSYTYQRAKEMYGNEHPSVFALGHGEMARSLSAAEVEQSLVMYQTTGQADLNSTMAPQLMAGTAAVASAAQVDYGTAYSSLIARMPETARRMNFIPSNANISGISTYSDLAAVIVPAAGQSHAQAMQVIMEETGGILSQAQTARVPMAQLSTPAMADVYGFLANYGAAGLSSVAGQRALNIVAKTCNTVGVDRSASTLEALVSYERNGGSVGSMDQARIILAEKAYSHGGSGSVAPQVIEVAAQQGYAINDTVPWGDIEKIAKGTLQVQQVVKNPNSAAIVFDNIARAEAASHGIDTSSMTVVEVVDALESRGSSSGTVVQKAIALSRQGGNFSDTQWTDSKAVEMLVRDGGSHPYSPQAINVVTRIMGGGGASPQHIRVVEEYLDNDGRSKDINLGNLEVATAIDQLRSSHASDPDWGHVKISPAIIKMVQRDPSYSAKNPNNFSADLIDRIVKSAKRFAPGGGGDDA